MRRNPLVPNADRPGSYLGSTPPHQLSGGQTWMQNATAANAALGQMQGTDFSTDEGFAQGHSIARTQKSASDALQGNVDRLRNASIDPSGANAYDMATSGQMLPFEAMQGASPYWSKQISDWARENYRRPTQQGYSIRDSSAVSRGGAPPRMLQDEAIGQLERIVGNMARGQGRTAQATRSRIGEYKAALMAEVPGESPEERARRLNSAWTDLSDHLNSKGLLNRFEQRLFKEGGKAADGIGEMLRSRITSELERQIMSEQAGAMQQAGAEGLVAPQRVRDQASRSRPGAARGAADAGVEERTPNGIRVSRFDSVDAAMAAIKGGTANVREGEIAVIGGMPMVATSGRNQFGDPELQFVTAITMGGVPVPDPEGVDASEWGEMLSPNARSAILGELSSNPQYRSAMSPEMIARVDQIRRSRVGLLAQRMNPRDRDAAIADLKQQETEALHAAIVGSVGGMARAATSQSLHQSRNDARDAIGRAREAEEDRYNESMKRLGTRPPLNAESASQVPGADAADMGGQPPQLRPDPQVASLWDLMSTEQRSSVTRMLAGLSMMAEETSDPQADFAQRHLPLSSLKRVLTLAGNGADEWTLAATIESARPGYLKANYGDDPRYVGGVNTAFESWQREYEADIARAGNNRAALMPKFLEMHSWFVINDALGLMNDDAQQFWSNLKPELKSSAQAFANHMMNARGGTSSSQPAPQRSAPAAAPAAAPPPAREAPDRSLSAIEQGMRDRGEVESADLLSEATRRMTVKQREDLARRMEAREKARMDAEARNAALTAAAERERRLDETMSSMGYTGEPIPDRPSRRPQDGAVRGDIASARYR
jgi:hypothetical protein